MPKLGAQGMSLVERHQQIVGVTSHNTGNQNPPGIHLSMLCWLLLELIERDSPQGTDSYLSEMLSYVVLSCSLEELFSPTREGESMHLY